MRHFSVVRTVATACTDFACRIHASGLQCAEAASLAARCRAVAAPYRAMRPNYMNLKNKKIGTAFVRQEGPGSSRASAGTEKIV
jgi:hypothetical protein